MRLVAKVNRVTGRVKHYLGATFQEDGKLMPGQEFPATTRVEIACEDDAYYLFRYDSERRFTTDTWHESLEDAKRQAKWEFEIDEDDWRERSSNEAPAFPDLVRKHFAYLLDEYGFYVTRFSDNYVELETDKCRVTIVLDKNTIDVDLCSLEREIIRRTHIGLHNIVPPTRLKELQPILAEDTAPSIADQDKGLGIYGSLLKEYGNGILKGDFSQYRNKNK